MRGRNEVSPFRALTWTMEHPQMRNPGRNEVYLYSLKRTNTSNKKSPSGLFYFLIPSTCILYMYSNSNFRKNEKHHKHKYRK